MGEVEVISTCLVGAAAAATGERSNGVSSSRRVELTPWDLQLLQIGPIQRGLLFHNPTPQQQQQFFNSNLIHHLKASLSSTLDFFPPLAGRFSIVMNEEENTCSVYVDCNNAGVEFVEAKAASGVTVAAILDRSNVNVPQILRSFFPLNDTLNRDGICKPLMGVQITELLDGYFIACALNHSLGDGTSFWNFFNSWAELSRGFHQPSTTPIHERWFPDNTTCPIHLPPMIEIPERRLSLDGFLTERVFHLSKESIGRLKEKANSEMGTNNSSSINISSLQSYMAHLWRAVTRARRFDSNEDVHLVFAIGTRQRMPLPEGYWGNAVLFSRVSVKAGDVLGKGLGWVAWQMKQAVQKHSHEEIMKLYMEFIKSPALLGVRTTSSPNNKLLVISSSPRFDVYGADFGWGKPVAVRSGPANTLDGKVTLFGGCEEEEGSVDVELSIHPHTLLGLQNDPEFLDYFTI